MRSLLCILCALSLSVPGASQALGQTDRARVIAALGHLMATGEPRHNSHDEGEWLQAQVDRAFAANDTALVRLARRAAAPLVANMTHVISSTENPPSLSVIGLDVLKLQQPAPYTAEILASVDGRAPVTLIKAHSGRGVQEGGSIRDRLPPAASQPGRHSLRLTARIRFADEGLGTEVRELPELIYAIYSSESASGVDTRSFIDAARFANVATLDPSLPAAPLGEWLRGQLKQHGGDFEPAYAHTWEGRYCDERNPGEWSYSAATDICAVALLAFPDGNNGISRVWIRTGRVERVDGGDTAWTSVKPSIEAIQLRTFDVATLGELPPVLALPLDAWPMGDVSLFPEDIRYTRDGGILHVHAVVRNGGNAEARDVQILFGTTTTGTDKGPGRLFVRSIPARDVLELTADLPFNAAHGAVFVQALQVSEHTTIGRWYSDPTPDDGAAFRIISAELAPPGYAEKLRGMCGGLCRGF